MLKDAREKRGLSQEWVAREAGTTQRYISKIENGKAKPGVEMLGRIAEAIGVTELPLTGSVTIAQPTVRWGDTFEVISANPQWVTKQVEAYVSAGPGGWDDDVPPDETMDVPELFMGPNYFVVRARGESMIDEQIMDGDYLIVERRPNGIAADKELVIAWLNDGLVIKRWYRRHGKKVLVSANPDWPERPITENDVFEIQGVVRHIIKNTKRIS